ncbi:5-oxoprolinase-like [Clavelina lepadiformis]|uniref:5-oxoprolinase-like n=1 Tax=Clavelina lepadiformis TaxID=159417 RepID=UPI004041CF62
MTSFVHMVVPACTNSTPKATHEFKTVAHPGITSSDIKYNISHSSMLRFNESRTILSGPAGGVMWYAMTSFEDKPIIGYNMEVEHFHHNLTSEQSQEVRRVWSVQFFRLEMFVVCLSLPRMCWGPPRPHMYRKGIP